jgi:AraC-like DNA-binding protein
MPRSAVRAPAPALTPFVSSIGYFEGDFAHARELALPSGSGQLLVNLDRDVLHEFGTDGTVRHRTSGAAMQGPASGPCLIDPADQRRIMWVAFRPGGLHPFFPPDAAAVRDQLVDLATVRGRDGATLRERLLEADGVDAKLRTLEAFLLARPCRPLDRDAAVASAVAALHRGTAVAAVADGLGWTSRRLARRFTEQVGLSPKRFARVRRFQRLLRRRGAAPEADWTRLAADCGYYDQAHLIHEFRALGGTTPGEYRPRSPDAPNHVPV